ncbi:MAG: hypothetical protein GX348_05850 [Veillonellaceae bacterium]|nr:hypothetical protein [Veillonellaceae bacterium]
MKSNFKRLVHGIMSIITTFFFMAAPVAAIVYSSESLEPSSTPLVRNMSDHQTANSKIKMKLVDDNTPVAPNQGVPTPDSSEDLQPLPR